MYNRNDDGASALTKLSLTLWQNHTWEHRGSYTWHVLSMWQTVSR